MVSSSTLSLIHPSLCASTHLPHLEVFLSWCFQLCSFPPLSITPSWTGPHWPCVSWLQNEAFGSTIPRLPLSCDAVSALCMNTMLDIYYILFKYSSINDGHLSCFHVLVIANSITVNTGVHVSFELKFSSFPGICPRVRLLDHMVHKLYF